MILENECEQLQKWFEQSFPDSRLRIHQGVNTKDKYEEYTIDVSHEGRHAQSALRIPPGGEFQDISFIEKVRTQFLETQKNKLTKYIQGLIH